MPTEMIHSLKNTGGDYTTIATWITNTSVDLTSAAVKVFAHGGVTGSIADGAALTGVTSSATGNAVGPATATQLMIDNISGTFQSGEQIQVDGSNHVTSSDAGDSVIAVLECYKAGFSSGKNETNNVINGATDSAANYREIRAAAGNSHDGTSFTSGFYLIGPAGGGYLLRVQEANSKITRIAVDLASTGATQATGFNSNSGVLTTVVEGCLVGDSGTGTNTIGFYGGAYTKTSWNACIALDCVNGFHRQGGGNANEARWVNCVAKDCTTGFRIDTANYDIRNSFAFGCTTSFSVGSGTDQGSTTNAASDGNSVTPPGTSPITVDVTSSHVDDSANDDMRPLDTATTTLHGTGSDQSALAPTDIEGVSFPGDTNIGCFATSTVVGGAGGPVAGTMGLMGVGI